uniref:L-type lectin-like domain-containing protein n=1 Tax=Cyanistes caeruleus TaxID=156563 RepID=A0A8C0Z837_CYACU
MFWNALERSLSGSPVLRDDFGMLWNVLECSGMFWNVPSLAALFWGIVLECSGMLWNALECSGTFWNALECSGTFPPRQPCYLRDWEMQVHFKIHGQGKKNLNGDGFAIWYTKDRMQPGKGCGDTWGHLGQLGTAWGQPGDTWDRAWGHLGHLGTPGTGLGDTLSRVWGHLDAKNSLFPSRTRFREQGQLPGAGSVRGHLSQRGEAAGGSEEEVQPWKPGTASRLPTDPREFPGRPERPGEPARNAGEGGDGWDSFGIHRDPSGWSQWILSGFLGMKEFGIHRDPSGWSQWILRGFLGMKEFGIHQDGPSGF